MNKWKCQYPDGCDVECTGTGSALGLRKIGWYVQPGLRLKPPVILCPLHNIAEPYVIDSSKWGERVSQLIAGGVTSL